MGAGAGGAVGADGAREWGIGAVMRCSTVSAVRVRALKVGERGRAGGAKASRCGGAGETAGERASMAG